ncbi:MAG: hypothetical protein V1722_03550 [Candidatus Micrarchaeota archaeon]
MPADKAKSKNNPVETPALQENKPGLGKFLGIVLIIFVVLFVIIFLVAFGSIFAYYLFSAQNAAACDSKDCFITHAQSCENATLNFNETYGLVHYNTTGNCTFTKTLVHLQAGESIEMKSAIEGKSLTCAYTKDNFNENLVNDLVQGIENCQGELKNTIMQMLVFTQ